MAAEIATNMIVRIRNALLAPDFDAFIECFDLPFVVETLRGRKSPCARSKGLAVFTALCDALETQGITDIDRRLARVDVPTDDWVKFGYGAENHSGFTPSEDTTQTFANYAIQTADGASPILCTRFPAVLATARRWRSKARW